MKRMFNPDQLKINTLVNASAYKKDASVSFGEYEGKPVVVKQGGDELIREAEILRHVDHPSFPEVIETANVGSSQVLVLERLEGTPLDMLINLDLGNNRWHSSAFALEEALRITDGLADCFEVLKNAGYIYRDLNLNHVLVSDDRVSLVDMEWSVPIDNAGKATVDSIAGTWETMAPEEFQVGNYMSESSTVYTLGVVLAQLVTGDNPFHIMRETVPDATMRRQATYNLHKSLPNINLEDERVLAFLMKCLQPLPADRHQSIEVFRSELALLVR